MAKRPSKVEHSTYASIDDIRLLIPTIDKELMKVIPNTRDQENYVTKCLKRANEWLNNQLEAGELNTFAKSNDKQLAEANYATYLIIRGLRQGERGENNQWVESYRKDAEKLIEDLQKKKAAAQGHQSITETFTKRRPYLKKNVRHHGDFDE
ncbi:MAG: hypothetical protein R3213_08210 [Flavobacteriaceae bacterium]|nr:hypothetical protein [Flavobacteriaceae bacterium]